jgi:hypothetical protein
MDRQVNPERRQRRRRPPPVKGEITATLRPGAPVRLSNVSPDGALVRSMRPIRPGSRVSLQVLCGERRLSISATVVRCTVAALHPLDGVSYAGALRFDQEIDWDW